jgi:acyl dehydratase
MDESFITPELQSRVGVPSEPVTVEVTPAILRRLRETLGSGDEDRVPPAVLWVPDAGREVSPLPGLPGSGILTGDEWELRRQIRPRETLVAVNRLLDLNERFGSRLGHTLTTRHEWTFSDAAGEPVAFARCSLAYYRQEDMPRREGPEGYGPPPPAAPLAAATGAGPHRAQPGDPLTSRLLTPTLEQVIRYIAVTWNITAIFFDPEAAKAAGLPGTLIPGPLKLGLLAEMVLDWAGPGALLESIRAAFRRPDTPGRPLLLGGSVTGAEDTESGRRLHCEVWAQNADGERSVVGAATVLLPGGG